MRRILPALITVLICSSTVAYFLLLPVALKAYSHSLLSVILFLLPIGIFFSDLNFGYFSTDASVIPLLHTWSLGVEEQFYIVWPLLLLLIFYYLSRRKISVNKGRVVKIICALLIIASLYFFFALTEQKYYYSLFTRAYELLFWLYVSNILLLLSK